MVIIVDAFFPFKIFTYLFILTFLPQKTNVNRLVWGLPDFLLVNRITHKTTGTRIGLFLLLFLYKNVTVLYITCLIFAYLT